MILKYVTHHIKTEYWRPLYHFYMCSFVNIEIHHQWSIPVLPTISPHHIQFPGPLWRGKHDWGFFPSTETKIYFTMYSDSNPWPFLWQRHDVCSLSLYWLMIRTRTDVLMTIWHLKGIQLWNHTADLHEWENNNQLFFGTLCYFNSIKDISCFNARMEATQAFKWTSGRWWRTKAGSSLSLLWKAI